MLKHHLAGGVRKGALTEEQAEAKFTAWLEEKASKIASKEGDISKAAEQAKAEALKAEQAVNEARIAAAQPEPEVAEGEDAPEATEAVADSEE